MRQSDFAESQPLGFFAGLFAVVRGFVCFLLALSLWLAVLHGAA